MEKEIIGVTVNGDKYGFGQIYGLNSPLENVIGGTKGWQWAGAPSSLK